MLIEQLLGLGIEISAALQVPIVRGTVMCSHANAINP